MLISEKSLELNVGAELLSLIRSNWGMPKAYLRGLTQKEEKAEGVDFFAQLSPSARLFALQFKAPQGSYERAPYRYRLVSEQHDLLYGLAKTASGGVFYVLPYYVTPTKLQRDVPDLLRDTWLLRVAQMPTTAVFGGQRTKIIRCTAGRAVINPEYVLENLAQVSHETVAGIPAAHFAAWYENHLGVVRREGMHTSPWLVRGLRVAIMEPEPRNRPANR